MNTALSILSALSSAFSVPFAEPPAVTLVDPATLTPRELYGDESPLPFTDADGWVYARRNLVGYATTNDGRCLPEGHPDLATDRSPDNPTCASVRACWHPSDPVGTRRHLYTQVDTTTLDSAPHDGAVVWDEGLVAITSSSGIFARTFDCEQDGVPEGTPLKVDAGTRLVLPSFYHAPFLLGRRLCGFWNPGLAENTAERIELACLSRPEDFIIHWPSGQPIFSGETVLRLADLDAHLGIPALQPNADGTAPTIFDQNLTPQAALERWLATPESATLPTGEVYLTLIRKSAATDGHAPGRYQHTRWLVRLPPDITSIAALTVAHRPRSPLRKLWPSTSNPDLELSRPVYAPQLDTLIFEANGQEFSNRRLSFCDRFGNCVEDIPLGTSGALSRGFWVLADSITLQLGYVSATDAFFSTARSYVQPASTVVEGATLTRMGDHLAWVFSSPSTPAMTRLIVFTPDHFDLDGDGLTAAEEDALSTSDLDFNSDDDLIPDRVERDLGLDPNSPTDPDEAPVYPDGFGATEVTTSALAQRRFAAKVPQDPTTLASTLIRSHAEDGPLCAIHDGVGRCFDAAGLEVSTFVTEPNVKARAIAYDGRHLVTWHTDGRLEALDLYTLALTDLGSPPPPPLDAGAEVRMFPRDGRTVYFVRMPSLNPGIMRYEDGAMTLAFDLEQAEIAAGLRTLPSSVVDTMGLTHEHFEVLGFVARPTPHSPEPELVFAVQGHWRRYILGLAADGTLRELLRTDNEGLGDIDKSAEWRGGLWADGPIFAPTGGAIFPVGLRLFTGDAFLNRPVPAFGALFVEQLITPDVLVQPQQAGLHELVAFTPALSPGETLVFASRWAGAEFYLGTDRYRFETGGRRPGMLFRVGLRGGMVPAWSLDPSTFEYDFVEVSGMDLDPRHHLCLADRGANQVWVYRPTQSGLAPTVLAERFAAPGVTDCRWREDGGLSLAVSSKVFTRPAGAPPSTFTAFVEDAGAASGSTFAKGPGVDLELVDQATFVAGPEAAFARVTYDGETLTTPWGTLPLTATSKLATKTPPPIALRPDGRVLVTGHILYDGTRAEPLVIADPSTPSQPTTYVALEGHLLAELGHATAVATVPWTHFSDPWTGAPLDPQNPFAEPSTSPTFPAPVAPTAGVAVSASTPPRQPEDEGCAGAPIAHVWLPLALWIASRARRRASHR